MIEISEELELTDEALENISGGLCVHPVGLGGGFGLGGHFGGFYGGGFGGFGGFYGGPVLVAQPQVALVPVQTVVESVPVTGVQATGCQQGVTLALV